MQIQDNPKVLGYIFRQLQENLKTRQTHCVQFRKKALSRLLEGYEKLQSQFDEALKKDLGLNPFMNNFLAHAITKNQISDIIHKLDRWTQPKSVNTPMGVGLAKSSIQYQPLGLVLVISAWNYPIYTALPPLAAAISAGNSVVLKPSQMAPYTSKVLDRLFSQYMDKKYYRCVQGKVQVAKAITKLPFDMICFTGSTTTGKSVAIQAAKNLTPCLLQLGGKCPAIVDQSADLESAALRILFGKLTNCGQTCVGVDHVYVQQKVVDKFKTILLKKLEQGYNLKQIKQSGTYANIINKSHVDRLTQYLNQNHGGKILHEGVIQKQNRFISPFVIQNPRNQSLLMTQEIFGPILPLKTYISVQDVIQQINDRPKPLVVYAFSSNTKNLQQIKKSTISGAFVVNDAIVQLLNSNLPFGGVGASGYGRYHGFAGFQAFSNTRSILETKAFDWFPFSNRFAPYTQSKQRMMTFLLKIGGIEYKKVGEVFKYTLLIAAGFGLYFVNKKLQPRL